jgi:hypothetical protein|tara:strand:- start:4174 stop:4764 length:591 start_codon:yes stop_codon:yes gene_type:complete
MAKEEDKLQEIAKGLGGVLAPSSQINDPTQMLAAIQNAALLRAGIGLLGRTQMGENEWDKAGRVLKDVSTDAAEQIKTLAATGTTARAAAKETRSIAKDAATLYDKYYFTKDEYTGSITQLQQDMQNAGAKAPTQEFFKNNLFNDRYVLGDTGQFDNFMRFHNKQTTLARDKGLSEDEYPTYEENFNTYEILRNSR